MGDSDGAPCAAKTGDTSFSVVVSGDSRAFGFPARRAGAPPAERSAPPKPSSGESSSVRMASRARRGGSSAACGASSIPPAGVRVATPRGGRCCPTTTASSSSCAAEAPVAGVTLITGGGAVAAGSGDPALPAACILPQLTTARHAARKSSATYGQYRQAGGLPRASRLKWKSQFPSTRLKSAPPTLRADANVDRSGVSPPPDETETTLEAQS